MSEIKPRVSNMFVQQLQQSRIQANRRLTVRRRGYIRQCYCERRITSPMLCVEIDQLDHAAVRQGVRIATSTDFCALRE